MNRSIVGVIIAAMSGVLLAPPAAASDGAAPRTGSQFDPYQVYEVSSWSESVAIGDVNSDGLPDVLLTTGSYYDPTFDFKLFVFLQQPDGSLAYPPVKYATDAQFADAMGLATGDLNGDGRTDVALATRKGIDVFLQGSAGLTGPYLQPTGGAAQTVSIFDMNADGRLDMVTNTTTGLLVMLNLPRRFRSFLVSAKVEWDMEVADLTGDGRLDIVGCEGANTCTPWLNVFAQGADGSFTETDYKAVTFYFPLARGVAVGDFNSDGYQDAAMTIPGNTPNGLVNTLAQIPGTGTLARPVVHASYDIPEPALGADVDGDGRADIVTLHGGWGEAGVYYQQLDGSLGPETLYPIPTPDQYSERSVAVGDISGDGLADIVIAGNGLVVLRQIP